MHNMIPILDDEPLLVAFLELLLQDALTHPDKLINADKTLAEDKAWLADLGIE
jgi:hypothetical protein